MNSGDFGPRKFPADEHKRSKIERGFKGSPQDAFYCSSSLLLEIMHEMKGSMHEMKGQHSEENTASHHCWMASVVVITGVLRIATYPGPWGTQ